MKKTHSKRIKLAFVYRRNQATDGSLLLFYQRRLSFGCINSFFTPFAVEWKRILWLSMTLDSFPTSDNSNSNCFCKVFLLFYRFGPCFFMHMWEETCVISIIFFCFLFNLCFSFFVRYAIQSTRRLLWETSVRFNNGYHFFVLNLKVFLFYWKSCHWMQ